MMDRAKALHEAGRTERFHTYPHLQPYNVATHSWGMAVLLHALHPNPSKELILAALLHDVAERWTGDLPWPAMQACPELNDARKLAEAQVMRHLDVTLELTDQERRWLKAMDALELFLYAMNETRLGNSRLVRIAQVCRNSLLAGSDVPQEVHRWLTGYNSEYTVDQLS